MFCIFNSIHSFTLLLFQSILYKPWISLNFFFFFVPKAFWSFLVFQTLKTCVIHLFHSLLPLPKRIRQGLTAWILFVSLFSLFQKNKGLTAWILLCLPSVLSKNSKRHSLRILLILPIPLYKSIQRTNRLRILLYPHSQSIKGLTAWNLCLNTLEGTSFVVQVEGTSTWVWLRTREGTSLVDQF